MSVAVKTIPGSSVTPAIPLPLGPHYRFSVKQFHRLIETGILNGTDRIELLEGWIVEKMTHNPPHDATVSLVQTELLARAPANMVVRIQSAITMNHSEPEPDAVVARGPARRYVQSHPRPSDIALIVEVADTTLTYDRDTKGRLYAKARIPVYWIINLVEHQVEIYSQPKAGKSPSYRQRQDYPRTETVPLFIKGRKVGRIAVQDLLP